MGEIHYFDNHRYQPPSWYLRRMPWMDPDQITFDRTPHYFGQWKAPVAIAR